MCRICQYNQVQDIDRLLLAGTALTHLTKIYPFSPSELQRHRQHLQEKIAVASKRFHAMLHQDLFLKLQNVMEMVLNLIRRTNNGDDPKLFLQATREFGRILRLSDKMAGRLQLDPEFIYSLTASYQWEVQEPSLLPSAFQAVAETRRTLKSNLFSPCPEPDPEADHNASAPLENLPAGNPPPFAGNCPDPLPEVFSPKPLKPQSQNQPSANLRAVSAP
jgi:hypothetical protein